MKRCYTWDRKCLVFPSACGNEGTPGTGACAETQLWFWILLGAGAVALFTKGKK